MSEIWLAADRGYLPVRIVMLEKDGTRFEHVATRISLGEDHARGCSAHARAALSGMLRFDGAGRPGPVALLPRAIATSGSSERAFVAETVFAVLRRKRSLEAAAGHRRAAGAASPRRCVRVQGLSARALQEVCRREPAAPAARGSRPRELPAAVRADLPDWLWERLARQHGEEEALRIAHGLLNPAPLDLRVNLARIDRERGARRGSRRDGLDGGPDAVFAGGTAPRTASRPSTATALFARGPGRGAGRRQPAARLAARAAARRDDRRLLRRRGRQDACRGDADARHRPRLRHGRFGRSGWRRSRRVRRAPGITNVHTLVLGEDDARARRLAGKLDRVLVDAPCSGFGTLRRNPGPEMAPRSARRSPSWPRSSATSSTPRRGW